MSNAENARRLKELEIKHSEAAARDQFAAAALTGLMASEPEGGTPFGKDWALGVAKNAYTLADAMLIARRT